MNQPLILFSFKYLFALFLFAMSLEPKPQIVELHVLKYQKSKRLIIFFISTEKDITNTEPLENTELTSVPDENTTDLDEIERYVKRRICEGADPTDVWYLRRVRVQIAGDTRRSRVRVCDGPTKTNSPNCTRSTESCTRGLRRLRRCSLGSRTNSNGRNPCRLTIR